MKVNTLILSACVLAGVAAGRATAGTPIERPSAPDTPSAVVSDGTLLSVAAPAAQDETRRAARPDRDRPERRDGARHDRRRGERRQDQAAARRDRERHHDARPERTRPDRTGHRPR